MKKFFFFALVLGTIGTQAQAATPAGPLALGFRSSDAPLGVRYWFSETIGADIGIGLETDDDGERFNWYLNLGLPITVVPTDRANLHVLPSLLWGRLDGGNGGDAANRYRIGLALEVEFFLSSSFAVSAAQGLAVDIFSPGGENASSRTGYESVGSGWTELGFSFYPGSN